MRRHRENLFGRESKSDFGEDLAPDEADEMHHGNTLFFRTKDGAAASTFPDVPWATEVAKDYADLALQLIEPALENGKGPRSEMPESVPRVEGFAFGRPVEKTPATHFWEYGQWLDPYSEAEHIRDHLLRSLIGTFSNVKNANPNKYATFMFDWMAFVPGQGEFHRYRGDYVLSESGIRTRRVFEDAVVANDGAFCVHCAFDNVLAAGKHISITHVAGSDVKFMGNSAQHGIAAVGIRLIGN